MLIPYKIKVAAAVVVLAAGAAGLVATGWQVRDWQADAADLARLESEAKATKRLNDLVDRVNASTSEAIAGIKPVYTTIRQETEREIRLIPHYSDCRHSPEQLSRINKALSVSAQFSPSGNDSKQSGREALPVAPIQLQKQPGH